jgi:TolB-like protein/Flp pilus assembly protein TadD
MRRDVFVSYASRDAAIANSVVVRLEQSGIRCWIAPRDVLPGTLYADGIVGAIDDSRILVLILSQAAEASAHVSRELERAVSKRHPIIALKVDGAPLNRAFEYFLNQSQWIEVGAGGMDGAIGKVVEAVGAHLSTGIPAAQASQLSAPRKGEAWRRRFGIVGAFVVLALVGGYFLANRMGWHAQGTAARHAIIPVADKSVAVLPFLDMSEKKDQEYFGDGMAEEIIDLLAKVPDLKVPARTSTFYFKGKPTKIPDIARELGVKNVLEGSIRRSGDQIRVTTQLIRADSGFHLWSQTYDRPLSDIFKVQDEIANAVVQALQITLMGGPLTRQKGGTENLEAYQLYLRARSSMLQATVQSLTAARDEFDQALKLDPDFGLAWAELSRDTLFLTNDGVFSLKEGYERARQQAQRALQVSPDLAEAHATLANIHRNFDWDWAAAEAEVRLALASDPTNPTALMRAGQLAYTLGRWDDAERQLRLALVRDPLFTIAIINLGIAQYGAGRFADADASFRRVLELAPKFILARSYLGKNLLAEGKPQEALATLQQAETDSERHMYLAIALQALGRNAESDDALKTLIGKYADSQAYFVAMTYAYRGDKDRAFQWLDRAYAQKDQRFRELIGERLFKNLESDPRYKAFLKKMNLPE